MQTTLRQLPAPELSETDVLKKRIEDLERELDDARADHEAERQERIEALRHVPEVRKLYKMLCYLFQEYPPESVASTTSTTPSASGDKWDKMKQKLGGKQSEVIQAIQDHGPSTRSQLRAITGSGMSTIDAVTARLRDMGIIVKSGDQWRLKE